MLYNPKWETKTKPDVFSLESLIAWLEKQPAGGVYCFFDNGGCMLHRYFATMRADVIWVGGITYETGSGERHLLPSGFDGIAAIKPHTFGDALARARKASE